VGAPNAPSIQWRYTNGATSGTWSLNAPASPGLYEFRYFLQDGYTMAAESADFTVSNSTSVTQTMNTQPAGLPVTIDGSNCTSPCTFQWAPGSVHTLAVASPQGTNWFSYWSDGGAQSHTITTPGSSASYTAFFAANPVDALRNCVSVSTSLTCTLPAGTHPVSSTINVSRPNVTITGGTGQRNETKLVRGTALTEPIIRVDAGNSMTGIIIRNLTVCGSSVLTPGPSPAGCPRTPTTCGLWTANWESSPSQCVDVQCRYGALSSRPFCQYGTL
jgi:hypothetical protein